jgi:hypothetical protein
MRLLLSNSALYHIYSCILQSRSSQPFYITKSMSFLFTSQSGEVFEVASKNLPLLASPIPYTLFDGASSPEPMSEDRQATSAIKSSPLVIVFNACDATDDPVVALPTKKLSSRRKHSVSDQSGKGLGFKLPNVLFAYNDYGELMDVEKLKFRVNSADLTVTETLRLILKAYHNKVSHVRVFDEAIY